VWSQAQPQAIAKDRCDLKDFDCHRTHLLIITQNKNKYFVLHVGHLPSIAKVKLFY